MEAPIQHIINYDGSFDGFLTAIFNIYTEKIDVVKFEKEPFHKEVLFSSHDIVITDPIKSKRVWDSLCKKTSPQQRRDLFKTFLSEIKGIEELLLQYIQGVFNDQIAPDDYSNKVVLRVSQIVKMVGREKHRMEAFVRFKLTKDDIYVSTIDPDFNVIPLLIPHFKDRYADQKWIIFDTKRNYGIYYDLKKVEIISFNQDFLKKLSNSDVFNEDELRFQKLWKTYFDNVNIKSRKNTKLHVQHLPKRYWKYLIEKNQLL